MRTKRTVTTCAALFVGTLSTAAMAAEPGAEGEAGGAASGSVTLGGDAGATAEGDSSGSADGERRARPYRDKREDQEWIKRWAPERNMSEVGLYGGVLLPSRRLELFEPDTSLTLQGFKEFRPAAPSLGLRLGYYPSRFFGAEGEAGVSPTRTSDDLAATIWGMRVNLVGQLGFWSVTPFVLAGGGMLNVASDRAAVGSDIDAALHFGGGVKFYLTRYTMLRIDIRDYVTAGRGVDNGVVHSAEALLGFSVTLGRKNAPPPPEDSDGDGILDPDDKCPTVPGVPEYDGCPIPDTDEDGILDPDDECVDTPGLEEFAGCPDTDEDGIRDLDDECPEEPGVPEYNGCPIPDTDGDGFLDPDDQCPLVPETKNGYQDEDGCCDVIPQEIKRFTGVIRGIFFDTNKAKVKRKSEKVLREALRVFRDYPDFKVEIIGHTDSRGSRDHNLDLSQRRAEAVKQWLVDRDIANDRIITRGAGPDEPLETNKTRKGRAKNRRIEFKLQLPPGVKVEEGPDKCEDAPAPTSSPAPTAGRAGETGGTKAGGTKAGGTKASGTSKSSKAKSSKASSKGGSKKKPPMRPKTPSVAPK